MKKPMIDTMMREKFDNLYTPKNALPPLLKYLPKSQKVWECCDPGSSVISQVLRENGYCVLSSDIATGFDFLVDDQNEPFDLIISNPPYSLKDRMLERCYAYERPFALLLPLTALEGKKRGSLYRSKGISTIVLDSRLDFTGKGANWFATAWFTYNLPLLPNNSLVFEEIIK